MTTKRVVTQELAVQVAGAANAAGAVVGALAARPFVGLSGPTALGAAARVLGLTVEALTNRLWAGERLEAVAAEAGVEVGVVAAAVEAATLAATRRAIAQGAAAGLLTRGHARWLAEGLAAGYWGGAGDGFGLSARA